MRDKKKTKNIKVRDLKPSKDTKGGAAGSSTQATTSHVTRSVTYNEAAHRIETQARRRTGKTADRIDFLVTTNAWPRYRCWYYARDGQSASYFKARVGIAGITEFTGSTWSQANVVSRIRLADRLPSEWSSFLPATVVTNGDGSTYKLYSSTISGQGLQAGATVTLTARIAEGFGAGLDTTGQENVWTGANKVKFDIVIKNYTYTSANSQLAIVTVAQSISARTMRSANSSDPDSGIDIGTGGEFMWFNRAWHLFKNGSGIYQPIVSSVVGDLTQEYATTQTDEDSDATETTDVVVHILTGSDQHPVSIEWDPEVSATETSAASRRLVAGASLMLALAIAAVSQMLA